MLLLFFILLGIKVLFANAQEYLSLVPQDTVRDHSNHIINDDLCDKQLTVFHNELRNREMWAVEMFDSWAKLQSGLFSMNTINLGDFDSCVRFRHATKSSGIIQGQHCITRIIALPNSTLEQNEEDGFSLKEV
jgi:hypothetical protein